MADFKENLYVSQYEDGVYSFYWEQIDLVTLDSTKCVYREGLTAEDIIKACENLGFDHTRAFKYFENHPLGTIHLTDQY